MSARETPPIRGAGGGGGGKSGKGGGAARVPVESPDSLRSRQYARVIDLVAEGEIVGLVDGLASVYLDDTPVESAGGVLNFSGVTLVERVGTQAQSYIPGFPSVESERAVSAEVTVAASVVRSISNTNVNAVRVTVGIPALTYQNPSTGDLGGTSVAIVIDVQNNGGGYVTYVNDIITGKTTSRYQRAYRIDLPGGGPWDIRLRRGTPDSTQSNLRNQTYWESYTEIIDSKLRYPNSALVAVAVDAEQFDSIPSRGYDIKGLLIQVPSNYNPVTRAYTGAWDGTFQVAWSDNPAWCWYDLVTNERYGLGEFISADQVDKWALYTIAQYCDTRVDDGFGGTEPRFTCNLYLQTQREAYTVINELASIFRGITYWAGGALVPVQDAPKDPVALFTPANVIDGQFNYEGTSAKARHTVALVSWNDPDDRYRQKIEYVEDAEGIARYGIVQTEVLAVGCTSRGQAHRVGRWLLYTERLEAETISFRTGLDGQILAPGDIIQTTDPTRAGQRMGGRIVSATTTAVTLDAAVTLVGGTTYTLWAVLPDGTVEQRTVITNAGSTSVLTVGTAFTAAPQAQAIWVLAAANLVPESWRVMGVREVDGTLAEIAALTYRDDKFDAIEADLVLEPLQTSSLTTIPAAVTNLGLTESLYLINPALVGARVTVGWTGSAPLYEVRWRRDEQNWQTVRVATASYDIQPAEPGYYEVVVVAINSIGRRSEQSSVTGSVSGLLGTPDALTSFTLQAAGGLAILAWALHPALDVRVGGRVRIRHSPALTGATWETSTTIGEALAGNATVAVLPLKEGTYLARAEDSSGVQSSSVSATTKQATALAWSPLTTVQEDDDFTGAHDGTAVDAGTLILVGATEFDDIPDLDDEPSIDYAGGVRTEGTYDFATGMDLGSVKHVRLTSLLSAAALNVIDLIDTRSADIDDWADFDGTAGSPVDAWVEVRETDDNPAGSPTWSAWNRLDAAEYEARGFDFRAQLISADASYTIQITQLRVAAEEIA